MTTTPAAADARAEPTVFRISDRLDGVRAVELRRELDDAVAVSACVVVDLSATTHVDGVGLAALVHAWRTARRHGGELTLVRPRESAAWRIFQLTAFDLVFSSTPAPRVPGVPAVPVQEPREHAG